MSAHTSTGRAAGASAGVARAGPAPSLARLFDLPAVAQALGQAASVAATAEDRTAWAAPLLRLAPQRLALQLAVMAGELPGWDNSGRAGLRRVAYVLGAGAPGCRAEALALCAELIQERGLPERAPSRHEDVFLIAVAYLLALAAPRAVSEASTTTEGAGDE